MSQKSTSLNPVPFTRRLLLKANILLVALLALYTMVVLLVMTPWVQTHVVYAHRIDYFGYNGFEQPENYGLAPGKTINLRLHASDNTSLGAWFMFSDPFYRTMSFPPSLPHTDESMSNIKRALSTSPTLLFLHGNTGTRALPLRTRVYSALTSRLGANVLALDYRGFGDSQGQPTVQGVAKDAKAAWEWLISMGAKEDEVLIMGHSLGTAIAGLLASQLGREGVKPKGLVLLSPFSSIRLLMDQYYLFGFLPLLKPLARLPFLPRVLTWSLAHGFDTLSLVPDIKCSVLIAHATDDWDISHTHSSVIFNALLDPYLPSFSPVSPLLVNASSPSIQAHVAWDWQGLTEQQAARAALRDQLVRKTVVQGFGTLDEFTTVTTITGTRGSDDDNEEEEERKIVLLKTNAGGHDIARVEGVQDVVGRMFGLVKASAL